MIKWIKKKLLEKIIKDLIDELPAIKEKAKVLLSEKKDELIEKVKTAIKEIIIKTL